MTGRTGAFAATSPNTVALVATGLLVNNILYLFAMPRIGPAEANVIAYLWPILLVLILSRYHRVPIKSAQWLGILVAFAGSALAIGPTFALGFDPLGLALAFASGFAFPVYAAIRSFGSETQDVVGPSMGIIAVICMGLHLTFEPATILTPIQIVAIALIALRR